MIAWAEILSAARPVCARLDQAMTDPGQAQRDLLQSILRENAGTEIGLSYEFSAITCYEDYRARVPVRHYNDYADAICRIAAGARNLLTRDTVIAFEETGGTASGSKLIPYTARSLLAFRDAVLPWLIDLAKRRPGIAHGRVYASISPATRTTRATDCGIPVGLDSDAAYLGEDLMPAFAALLAVSPMLGRIQNVDDWRLATLVGLVARPDLSLISVWSPTFLNELLPHILRLTDQIAAQLELADRQRFLVSLHGGTVDTAQLWPILDTISCWTDGASAAFIPDLRALFPHVHIDPKGLLATEAAITTGYGSGPGAIPALLSCFVEYLGTNGEIHLCDQLTVGETYDVLLTSWGGFYRYAIGDVVRCVAKQGLVPRLTFEGRRGVTSDLVGEKLDDAFVVHALSCLDAPAVLVPHPAPHPHYALWVDAPDQGDFVHTQNLLGKVEAHLRANPQYAYARDIGQLGELALRFRSGFTDEIIKKWLASGIRLGDTKAIGLMINAGEGK